MVKNGQNKRIIVLGDHIGVAKYHPVDNVFEGIKQSLDSLGEILLCTEYESICVEELQSYDFVVNYIDRYDLINSFGVELHKFIKRGGRVLNLHNGILCTLGDSRLEASFGGRFVTHPPYGRIICEIDRSLDWLSHIHDFVVDEEAYIIQENGALPHKKYLYCIYEGMKIAAGWIIDEHPYCVGYLGLGHDGRTFENEHVRQLLRHVARHLMYANCTV